MTSYDINSYYHIFITKVPSYMLLHVIYVITCYEGITSFVRTLNNFRSYLLKLRQIVFLAS